MTRFAILLSGRLTMTDRLIGQIRAARVIAADGGMAHARSLGLEPELWLGDFDSSDSALGARFAQVAREVHPADKNATDGELAVAAALKRGAAEIVLVGGLGGQIDHALGSLGLALRLAKAGIGALVTSGDEEAYPVLAGELAVDLSAGARLSLVPWSDLEALSLDGVKWPLDSIAVTLGSSLTLSNIAHGPVRIRLGRGHGVLIAYPRPA